MNFVIDDRRSQNSEFEVQRVSTCRGSYEPAVIDSVEFRCAEREGFIAVSMTSKAMKITRAWNDETVNCDYRVDGKVLEPWQISKATLADLLFW